MFITLHNLSVTYSNASVLIIDNVVLSEESILFSLFFLKGDGANDNTRDWVNHLPSDNKSSLIKSSLCSNALNSNGDLLREPFPTPAPPPPDWQREGSFPAAYKSC